MSDSGVRAEVARRGIVIKPGDVKVGDEVRLEFGHGNYTTGLVSHDGATWWVDGNDLHGDAYDPEFNDGKRRVVLLKRDGLSVDGQGALTSADRGSVLLKPDNPAATVEPEWARITAPPGTRPEFEVPWQSVQVGDEVRLEFDDHSAEHPVTGIVADSGDGLCVYVTRTGRGPADKEYGYQIDRPNRRVIMLRRAQEVALDAALGVDKLRLEYTAAANVLLGALMLGPASPKIPEDPSLVLLAYEVQGRFTSLLHTVSDHERAAAVLAVAGYTSNAPYPLAASVGTAINALKYLTEERKKTLGTVSDFGLARSVAREAGFDPDESLASAVRAMANRITELEKGVRLHEGARKTADGAAGEALEALERIRAQVSETIVSIPDLPVMVARKIGDLQRDNRLLANDGQAWESKHAAAVEANQAHAGYLDEIRALLIDALADPAIAKLSPKHLPSQVGRALMEARRAGRTPIAGGPGGLSDRIMDLINNQFPGALNALRDDLHHKIMIEIRRELHEIPEEADRPYSARLADIINRVLPPSPSVSTGERKRLHDAIMAEFYAHPGDRLSRPAAAFLADQLVSDVGEVLDTTPESERVLRSAFIETALEFFSDADEGGTSWAPESQPERMAADLLRRAAEAIEAEYLDVQANWSERWLDDYREWLGANPAAAATEDDPLKHAADGAPEPTIETAFSMLGKTLEDAGKELLHRWESITRGTPWEKP